MEAEEQKIQISDNRYVEVSKFRGKTYVSIREYYQDSSGQQKPSKKGISLTVDQWKKLVESTEKINDTILNYHV